MSQDVIHRKITTLKKVIANNLVDKGLFSKKSDKRLVVLMYHGVDKKQNTNFNERFFSSANFERQIALFKKHLNILTYADLVNDNYATGKTNVLLTFDDGYANNFTYALPVLEKYNAHALFFITGVDTLTKKILWADALDIVCRLGKENEKVTINDLDFYLTEHTFINKEKDITLANYIRASTKNGPSEKEDLVRQLLGIYDFTKIGEMDDYWQLMTADQIQKASLSKNITIGSHGFYHNNLGSLPNDDAVNEAMLSKNYLEGIIQKEVSCIGFPDGSYTQQLNESLYEAGYKKQFLVDYRYGDKGTRDYTYDRYGLYPGLGSNNRLLYKILNG